MSAIPERHEEIIILNTEQIQNILRNREVGYGYIDVEVMVLPAALAGDSGDGVRAIIRRFWTADTLGSRRVTQPTPGAPEPVVITAIRDVGMNFITLDVIGPVADTKVTGGWVYVAFTLCDVPTDGETPNWEEWLRTKTAYHCAPPTVISTWASLGLLPGDLVVTTPNEGEEST
jgi:hypothetical protein